MPHHKSAKKRVRQTQVKNERNKANNSETRSAIKAVRLAITNGDKEGASKLLVGTQKLLDRLAKRGVIKPNNAARRTSRLASQINKL